MTTKEFPPDVLLYHILPRLPASSVLRFMCVSKQWYSFITTPMFKKMHQHHIINDNNHHKRLLLISTTEPYKFSSIDCEAPEDGLAVSRRLPFRIYNNPDNMCILTCFHGLVCVGLTRFRDDNEYFDLILWNPLTNEYKTLSRPNRHIECYDIEERSAFALYYSSSEDDYKLLCVTYLDNVYIYSLKSDSWRKIDVSDAWISESWWPSIYLNEKLYFLEDFLGQTSSNGSDYTIVRFDTKTEKFTDITTPAFRHHLRMRKKCLSFIVVSGKIHLFVAYENTKAKCMSSSCVDIEVWSMDGDREWTKVATYDKQPCLEELTMPLHVMRSGDWLMNCESSGYFYVLDMEENSVVIRCLYTAGSMKILPRGIYIESFVSPNR